MTSAPATARPASGRAALALPGSLGRLTPVLAALVVTLALAIATHTLGALVALGLAVLLLAVSVMTLSAGRGVTGMRAAPRWYPLAALVVAAVVLIVRESVSGWSTGFRTADAVLLAAAPGALLMATELPLWLAVRRGRAGGVTLRDTAALPAAAATRVLALDGISTVVDGKVVDHVEPVEQSHERNLRWFAGAVAHASDTPWGKAVAKLSVRGNLTDVHADRDGISGYVDRHPVRLGSLAWLGGAAPAAASAPASSAPASAPTVGSASSTAAVSSTTGVLADDVLGVEVDGRSLGTITIADKLRESVAGDVAALTAAGVRPVLVEADGPRTAAIAALAGTELVAAASVGGPDCAVVSDEPAGFAGVGLRLGPAEDHVRLDHADLGAGARALQLCRMADHAVHRGVVLALGWHAVCVVLVVVGVLDPWMAATAALAGAALVCAYAARAG